MGLPHSHGGSGACRLLKEHEVPKPGAGRLAELAFAEGLPEIGSGTESLFGAVIVVVPERRSDVGLHFQRGQEQAVLCDNKVPLLDRPEETRQLKVLLQEQARLWSASLNEEFAD